MLEQVIYGQLTRLSLPVKVWLHAITCHLLQVLSQSGLKYVSIPIVFGMYGLRNDLKAPNLIFFWGGGGGGGGGEYSIKRTGFSIPLVPELYEFTR